jgi:hypothetical protein
MIVDTVVDALRLALRFSFSFCCSCPKEAGKNVIQMFKNRGWDAIIADDL